MKGYVGTLMNLPESVEMAERCVVSGKKFNIDVDIFPAVYKDIALEELKKENLKLATWNESFSNVEAVVGNFITQYRIWNTIVSSNEAGIVLEHDAIFIDTIPTISDDIVNIGKPSYGAFITKQTPGTYPMFSKSGGYIPGAHGYYLSPTGAQELINKAKDIGATPCDLFLNKTNFPNIKEIYPWVVEAKDEFTTIQKEKGCIAKHNYNQKYKIL